MDMKVNHEEVRNVSGIMFQIVNEYEEKNESYRLVYMIYLKGESKKYDFVSLYKFIRISAMPYRIVLLDNKGIDRVCFLLYGNEDEAEEMNATMDWIARIHPEWNVLNKTGLTQIPRIIGIHIPNNSFHARKLLLQGEVLD